MKREGGVPFGPAPSSSRAFGASAGQTGWQKKGSARPRPTQPCSWPLPHPLLWRQKQSEEEEEEEEEEEVHCQRLLQALCWSQLSSSVQAGRSPLLL